MPEVILEELAKKHHTFISSVKYGLYPSQIIEDLNTFDVENYPLNDWNYSLSYIYDKDFDFKSYEELKNYLLNGK